MAPRPRGTSTSAFGVSKRESHDASGFYGRFEAPAFSSDDEVIVSELRDEIVVGDSRSMTSIADGSVALVVTSPPYFAGKQYEVELERDGIPASYLEYLEMLHDVFADCARVLEPGGRIAVNVANLGRKPYRSLSADVIGILQDRLGLLLRGEIIWQKAQGASGSCAWGSFRRPSNPVLRDVSERVIVASKGRLDRAVPQAKRAAAGLPSHATSTADEFMEATLDIWTLPTESATRVGHPAPFPVELPQRLIELFTYEGDVVLDPFMGSGTTAVAATRTGRHFLGYDTDPEYVEIALKRVAEESAAVPAIVLPGGGNKATDVAATMLTDAGFVDLREKPTSRSGAAFAFSARDHSGTRWLIDVVGGFTTGASGLRRSDALWRCIGQATVVCAEDPAARVLVLTTELPKLRSAGAKALDAIVGTTIVDALRLDDPATPARLAELSAR